MASFQLAQPHGEREPTIHIYHFDTSHQRKPQGYISNIPWEPVYIMIYPTAMVTSHLCRNETIAHYIGA